MKTMTAVLPALPSALAPNPSYVVTLACSAASAKSCADTTVATPDPTSSTKNNAGPADATAEGKASREMPPPKMELDMLKTYLTLLDYIWLFCFGIHLNISFWELTLYSSFSKFSEFSFLCYSSLHNWNLNVKLEPSPTLLRKVMSPLNWLTIWSDITKPKPMPFVFIC